MTTFVALRQVQTHDINPIQQIDTASLVRWLEETEYAYLRSRGLSVSLRDELGQLGFPRLSVEIELCDSAVPGEWTAIELDLDELSLKSIRYAFRVVRWPHPVLENGSQQLISANVRTIDRNAQCQWQAGDQPQSTGVEPTVLARGKFTIACCRFPAGQLPRAILIPDWIIERLSVNR